LLRDGGHLTLGGLFGRQVRAPGDDAHTEHLSEGGDLLAHISEAQHAQREASETGPETALPAAAAHRLHLLRQVPGGGKDQCPGELGGRVGEVASATDNYAELSCCLHVDRGIDGAGG